MSSRLVLLGGALFLTTVAAAAQQPANPVPLGVIRVPPCQPASDPEYGLVQKKPIPIGGGPMYMAGRQRNYLNALRGPQGQVLRIGNSVGSAPVPGDPERAIVDSFSVSYDGENGPVGKTIFMDAYHFDAPKVPVGFTCGAPLAAAVGLPPADPFRMTPAVIALAVEHGTSTDVPPIPLDTSTPRGYLFDQYGSVALRARAAAAAGTPLDAKNPSRDLQSNGWSVLAIPVSCGDRTIAPANVELSTAQGTVAREEFLRGEELPKAFPGLPTPAGSLGFRFRNGQPTQVKITYAEGCSGAAAQVLLPLRREPPRLVELVPGVVPPGVVEAEPVVYVQVVVDPAGHIVRPEYLGGPRSLYPAALDALAKWSVQPIRINGVGVVTPNVVQVPFRP